MTLAEGDIELGPFLVHKLMGPCSPLGVCISGGAEHPPPPCPRPPVSAQVTQSGPGDQPLAILAPPPAMEPVLAIPHGLSVLLQSFDPASSLGHWGSFEAGLSSPVTRQNTFALPLSSPHAHLALPASHGDGISAAATHASSRALSSCGSQDFAPPQPSDPPAAPTPGPGHEADQGQTVTPESRSAEGRASLGWGQQQQQQEAGRWVRGVVHVHVCRAALGTGAGEGGPPKPLQRGKGVLREMGPIFRGDWILETRRTGRRGAGEGRALQRSRDHQRRSKRSACGDLGCKLDVARWWCGPEGETHRSPSTCGTSPPIGHPAAPPLFPTPPLCLSYYYFVSLLSTRLRLQNTLLQACNTSGHSRLSYPNGWWQGRLSISSW